MQAVWSGADASARPPRAAPRAGESRAGVLVWCCCCKSLVSGAELTKGAHMGTFATDRDLLVYEPGLLGEAGWAAQRRFAGGGTLSGTNLTINAGGSPAAAGIARGSVLLIGPGATVEVLGVSGQVLSVSLLRADGGEAPIAPATGGSVGVQCWSFGPQVAMAHRQLLRMVGVDEVVPPGALGLAASERVSEAQITNPGALVALEALMALRLIYAALPTGVPGGDRVSAKLALLGQRVEQQQRVARVLIDTDMDGEADVVRRVGVVPASRM